MNLFSDVHCEGHRLETLKPLPAINISVGAFPGRTGKQLQLGEPVCFASERENCSEAGLAASRRPSPIEHQWQKFIGILGMATQVKGIT